MEKAKSRQIQIENFDQIQIINRDLSEVLNVSYHFTSSKVVDRRKNIEA